PPPPAAPLSQPPAPDPLLDVGAAARLQHHRVDALQVQQVRQQQPRRPGPADPPLGPQATSLVAMPRGGCYARVSPTPSGGPASAAAGWTGTRRPRSPSWWWTRAPGRRGAGPGG